ncbi:hypothetical protein VP01_935g1 [Puccinia sorghi]|uniref:Uncharacterized protein n=1 Tax=Puccinia sorghi TaxID=27349 RepID=A0A0L6U6W7_9BASI|nr:hypothetical protein VP01_935g1 [Puccinia sorghi]
MLLRPSSNVPLATLNTKKPQECSQIASVPTQHTKYSRSTLAVLQKLSDKSTCCPLTSSSINYSSSHPSHLLYASFLYFFTWNKPGKWTKEALWDRQNYLNFIWSWGLCKVKYNFFFFFAIFVAYQSTWHTIFLCSLTRVIYLNNKTVFFFFSMFQGTGTGTVTRNRNMETTWSNGNRNWSRDRKRELDMEHRKIQNKYGSRLSLIPSTTPLVLMSQKNSSPLFILNAMVSGFPIEENFELWISSNSLVSATPRTLLYKYYFFPLLSDAYFFPLLNYNASSICYSLLFSIYTDLLPVAIKSSIPQDFPPPCLKSLISIISQNVLTSTEKKFAHELPSVDMQKVQQSLKCYSHISPRVIQPRFYAHLLCMLQSYCAKKTAYTNRWSLDGSLTGECCMSTAGNAHCGSLCSNSNLHFGTAKEISSHENEMTYLMNIDMRLRNKYSGYIITSQKFLGALGNSFRGYVYAIGKVESFSQIQLHLLVIFCDRYHSTNFQLFSLGPFKISSNF